MCKPVARSVFALLMLLIAVPAVAAGNMKAGLWELTTQSDMLKSMPKASPEQIEQMRKMGVDMAQLQSGAIVSKVCVTKEMAERDELPQMKHKGCELRNQQHHGSSYTMDMICDGTGMKGKGTLKTVFASTESFSSRSEFHGTVQGTPVNDRTDTSGKWLGADCGSIKPVPDSMPKK